ATKETDKPAKALRLTPSGEQLKSGSAFTTEKVKLRDGFDMTFRFQITEPTALDGMTTEDKGADGFAVVIQNSGPTALGGAGSGLGYAVADEGTEGIARSVAIEFDTFDLAALGESGEAQFGDPNNNHISVH